MTQKLLNVACYFSFTIKKADVAANMFEHTNNLKNSFSNVNNVKLNITQNCKYLQ